MSPMLPFASFLAPLAIVLLALWVVLLGILLLGRRRHDARVEGAALLAAGLATPARRGAVMTSAARVLVGHLLDTADPAVAEVAAREWLAVPGHLDEARTHARSGATAERLAALRMLATAGHPDALPLLSHAMDSRDPELAAFAAAALGRLDTAEAAQVLAHALAREAYTPARLATQLERMTVPLAAQLEPLLDSPSPTARHWAATLLAGSGGGASLEARLASALDDADPRVRRAAVAALGRLGAKAQATAIARVVSDPVAFVRANAVRALAALGDPTYGPLIADCLGDENWWVRRAAQEALESLAPAVVPLLAGYLEHPDRFARNTAAEALQDLGVIEEAVRAIAERAETGLQRDVVTRLRRAGLERMLETAAARLGVSETVGERLGAAAAEARPA